MTDDLNDFMLTCLLSKRTICMYDLHVCRVKRMLIVTVVVFGILATAVAFLAALMPGPVSQVSTRICIVAPFTKHFWP